MNIYFIGQAGSDAGGWFIGADGKVHRIPGWNPDAMSELSHAVKVIREAGLLKTPDLLEATIKGVIEFAQKELGQHIKDGGVIVLDKQQFKTS